MLAKVASDRLLREVRHALDVSTSTYLARGVLGLAVVLRAPARHTGPIIEEHAEAWAVFPQGSTTMFAILRALEIAKERGLRVVRIRTADNSARNPLKKRYRAGVDPDARGLMSAVLHLARSLDDVQFRYARTRKLWQANLLARKAAASSPPRDSHPIFESLPPRPCRVRPPWPASWEAGALDDELELSHGDEAPISCDELESVGHDLDIPF